MAVDLLGRIIGSISIWKCRRFYWMAFCLSERGQTYRATGWIWSASVVGFRVRYKTEHTMISWAAETQ